jgi:hypothetical protein
MRVQAMISEAAYIFIPNSAFVECVELARLTSIQAAECVRSSSVSSSASSSSRSIAISSSSSSSSTVISTVGCTVNATVTRFYNSFSIAFCCLTPYAHSVRNITV